MCVWERAGNIKEMQTFLHVCETQQRCVSRESQGTLIIFFFCFRLSLVYSVPAAHSLLSLHTCVCQLCCHCSALGPQPNLAALHNLSCCHILLPTRVETCGLWAACVDVFSMWCYFAVCIPYSTCREHIITVLRYTTHYCANKKPGMFVCVSAYLCVKRPFYLLRSLWNEWWLSSTTYNYMNIHGSICTVNI